MKHATPSSRSQVLRDILFLPIILTLLWGCAGVTADTTNAASQTSTPTHVITSAAAGTAQEVLTEANPSTILTATEAPLTSLSPTPTASAQALDPVEERVRALQESLYRASLEYLADTTAEAKRGRQEHQIQPRRLRKRAQRLRTA